MATLPTSEELIAKYKAGGQKPLTTEQITGSPITVDSLTKSQTPIDVSSPTTPTDTYSSALAQGAAAITGADTAQPAQNESAQLVDLFKKLGEQPKVEDAYVKAQQEADIVAKQQAVIANKQKRDTLTAQLKGITDKQQADLLQLQEDAKKRGIVTTAGLAPEISAINRNAAIASLPLQSQILAAQAELTGSQETLALAQDQLNTVFKLRSEDAKNAYDYKSNIIDKLFTIADKKQSEALQVKRDEASRNFSLLTDAINNSQSIASNIQATDPTLASQIAQIPHPDLNSKTLAQDITNYNNKVAALQAKVVAKATDSWSEPYTLGGDIVQKNTKTGEIRTAVNVPKPPSSTTNPLNVLDVARYNDLYPDAGVTAGDTEAQANAKVAAVNTPEGKLTVKIQSFKTAGNTYEKVVKDINDSKTITDKTLALKIAAQVYGKTTTPIDKKIPTSYKQSSVSLFENPLPGIVNSISSFLFGKK